MSIFAESMAAEIEKKNFSKTGRHTQYFNKSFQQKPPCLHCYQTIEDNIIFRDKNGMYYHILCGESMNSDDRKSLNLVQETSNRNAKVISYPENEEKTGLFSLITGLLFGIVITILILSETNAVNGGNVIIVIGAISSIVFIIRGILLNRNFNNK